ncbi:MAG TPA: AvaI/BsoBI family type II restriction endonuclease [Anaerolineae bacterium]|nr:AvaI/BsoBI family type II restriction endonuclease [Anaerolineae bacterium]
MTEDRPYLRHLLNSQALVTTREAKRAGFVEAVIEKSRLADRFVRDARTLKLKAEQAAKPEDLLDNPDIQAGLLTAAGVSDKATAYFDATDRHDILMEYIEKILKPAGDKFVEELVYRFLLTRGDTLGGKIRNLVGVWAQRKFSGFIVSDLSIAGRDYQWFDKEDEKWKPSASLIDLDQVRAFAWDTGYLPRVLAYNLLVPLIKTEEELLDDEVSGESSKGGKNIDICLLHSTPEQYRSKAKRPRVVRDAELYVALGELKGGIDPAGADEHWKTANAHLGRIRRSFGALESAPLLFFVGNAIEASMAGEIWNQLQNGQLSNAANLTDDRQAVSLVSWLCNL